MMDVLKTLHVAAMALWLGGSMTLAVAARGAHAQAAARLRRVALRLVTPAMLVTLSLGLYLAVSGGWFRSGWLQAKLVLVLILVALHGVLSGLLRRAANGSVPSAGALALCLWGLPMILATAIWLALAKPAG